MRANHRHRSVLVGLVVAAMAMLMSACGGSETAPRGTATGRIEACNGLAMMPVRYVGGNVIALKGVVGLKRSGTVTELRLPNEIVGRQRVPTGGEYHFTLPPGPYVIDLPHYGGGNVGTYVSLVIANGKTVHADLPDDCK
jgi:hypothetical protein